MSESKIDHENTCETERLDTLIAKRFSLSRKDAKRVIEAGLCRVDGIVNKKPSANITAYSLINLDSYDELLRRHIEQSQLLPRVVFEDDDIIVLDKPSGLTVHEGNGTTQSTLVDWLKQNNYPLASCTGENREGIVHRLDRETSGLLVVAKNDTAATILQKQFKEKSAGRYYMALIDSPLKEDCIVEANIDRHPTNRIRMCVSKTGKEAKSAFKKLLTSRDGKSELIGAKLFSGRTHQIRAHLLSIGRHIIGDGLYGFNARHGTIEADRVMLHAAVLYFIHPRTGRQVTFFALPPEDFIALFEKHFTREKTHEIFERDSLIRSFDTVC